MSRLPECLKPTEEDIKMLLACQTHIGTKNGTKGMEPYIYKRRVDGYYFFLSFLLFLKISFLKTITISQVKIQPIFNNFVKKQKQKKTTQTKMLYYDILWIVNIIIVL